MDTLQFSSSDELGNFLVEKGVDISQYGKQLEGGKRTKEVDDLFGELNSGEVILSFDEDSGRIMRQVQVLNIHILYGGKELYEEKQVFKDTNGNENSDDFRAREHLTVAVSEKMSVSENPHEAIKRAVREELDGIILSESQVESEITTTQREAMISPSFPQIWTIYQVLTTSIELTDEQYNPDGYIEEQAKKNTYFKWRQK